MPLTHRRARAARTAKRAPGPAPYRNRPRADRDSHRRRRQQQHAHRSHTRARQPADAGHPPQYALWRGNGRARRRTRLRDHAAHAHGNRRFKRAGGRRHDLHPHGRRSPETDPRALDQFPHARRNNHTGPCHAKNGQPMEVFGSAATRPLFRMSRSRPSPTRLPSNGTPRAPMSSRQCTSEAGAQFEESSLPPRGYAIGTPPNPRRPPPCWPGNSLPQSRPSNWCMYRNCCNEHVLGFESSR